MNTGNLRKLFEGGTYEDFLGLVELTKFKEVESLPILVDYLTANKDKIKIDYNTIDVCGTGGDRGLIKTINISTISAIILASIGIKVAKHGGGSITSNSGSIDFIEALGIQKLDPTESLEKHSICFLDSRDFYPELKQIASFRKRYGKPTIFNLVGPLLNPIDISHQVVGVSFPSILEDYSLVLSKLRRKRFTVVQSKSGYDELLSFEENTIYREIDNKIQKQVIDPKAFGMRMTLDSSIEGRGAKENAEKALRFFERPEQNTLFYTLLLNCAVAIQAYGLVENLQEGIDWTVDAIKDKKPLDLIHQLITV